MKKVFALSALAIVLASSTALADTSGKKIAFSNNYAGNSWRQAMLNSYDIVSKKAVADKVVPAGGKITLTENIQGFGQKVTEVVYFQDRWRDGARRLLDAMGCGSLRKARKDLGISDVTIVVGSDCPQYGAPEGIK